jgi:hypothetical protein
VSANPKEPRSLAKTEPIPLRPGDDKELRPVGAGIPETTEDGLTIRFPAIDVEIELTEFDTDSNGDPTAMVTVYQTQGGQPRLFAHRSRLLLFGTNARDSFVRLVNKRTARWTYTVDWTFVTEQIGAFAKEYVERGEPLVDLWELDPPATTPYLFSPLLPLNEVTLLYGSGGTLKSFLALLLCLAVAYNVAVPIWGRPAVSGLVLYLDWETNPETHARRLRALAAGLGLGRGAPGQIMYRRMKAPIHIVAGQIRKLIREYGFVLVVIDSAGMSTGGNVNAPDDVVRTMDAISTLGTTTTKLLIGHKNKAGEFIGNVYWFNQSRAVWEVNAEQMSRTSHRAAYLNTKNNNDALADPVGAAIDFEPGGRILFEEIDAGQVQVARTRMRPLDRVYAAIVELAEEGAAVTFAAIKERSGIDNDNSLRSYISTLERTGRIQRTVTGVTSGRPQEYAPVTDAPPAQMVTSTVTDVPDDADTEEDEDDEPELPF